MHSELIEATREEVLRLLGEQDDLFLNLLEIPDLLTAKTEENEKKTDKGTVKNWQSILGNEAKKVDQLEIVLTVLGTMKAGKSTTINAIVGHEVLPNRNYPMTTLPTLIRHRRGQLQPILRFSKRIPIEEMIDKVRKSLVRLNQENSLDSIDLIKQDDGQEIVRDIITGRFSNLEEIYEGQESIFDFLKFINDLMRLSRNLDNLGIQIDLPFEEYKSIDDFPVIEVEFFHLSQLNHLTKGSIALLDTPGPNDEVLGHELRQIFNAQIERSSALLVVLDYTQLGGEAGAEIRNQLTRKAFNAIEERSFFLVNKFDQKQKRGMKSQEVKRHVSEVEMNGKISQDKVYPVSALSGYLANRALYEINIHGNLPEDEMDGWVADFGKLAMGETWDPEELEIDEIKVAAERVWKSSRFDSPLQEVVFKAANTAALVSMQSAVDKMIEFGSNLENFLEIQNGSLTKNVEEIRLLIDRLAMDIENVQEAENRVESELNTLVSKSLDVIQLQYEKAKEKLRLTLEEYFREGKKIEGDQLLEKIEKLDQEFWNRFSAKYQDMNDDLYSDYYDPISSFMARREREKEFQKIRKKEQIHKRERKIFLARGSADFDPDNPKVKFESEQVAKFFLSQINQRIDSLINESSQEFELLLKDLSEDLEEGIPKILSERVGDILDEAKNRLRDHGFSLIFNVPEPNLGLDQMDIANMLLVTDIEASTRITTTTRWGKKKGWFNDAKRWVSDKINRGYLEWGYGDIVEKEEEKVYIVDMEKIKKKVLSGLDENMDSLRTNSQDFWDLTLRPLVKSYFDSLKDYLEIFRGDLREGIDKHKLDEDKKQKLMEKIFDFKNKLELHSQDILVIKENLK